MSAPETIGEYLLGLHRSLRLARGRRSRVFDEVHEHLRDAASAMERDGASRAEAERRAIIDFGAPDLVADTKGRGWTVAGIAVMLTLVFAAVITAFQGGATLSRSRVRVSAPSMPLDLTG